MTFCFSFADTSRRKYFFFERQRENLWRHSLAAGQPPTTSLSPFFARMRPNAAPTKGDFLSKTFVPTRDQ
jgi:hypothetical protein